MPTVEVEQVMVVKTELFRQCGYFQGFNQRADLYLGKLLDPSNTVYLPRDQMEIDPTYKQLIPYCIFQSVRADGVIEVFQYRRGSGQGESRLHKKRSVGIGGHISTLDSDDHSPYLVGMQRELDEEVWIETAFDEKLIGLINDDETEVGRVHLGIVHLFTVEEPNVRSRETAIIESGFRPVACLLEQLDDFESWSQICLKAVYGQ
jgi:predicted NUDIX family phosphoesterase